MSSRLTFRTPYRWDALRAFLSARTIDAIETFEGDRYSRGDVRVQYDGASLRVNSAKFADRARRMFDLDADPDEIARHLQRDPVLRPLVQRFLGTRVPGGWEPFEIGVRAIVGQQISVRGATTIMNRLAPILTPAALADAEIVGMPRSRAETIRSFARAVADDATLLAPGESLDDTIERLVALRGIGPWTANYIAMRALRQPDAFPSSDLGLQKAAKKLRVDNLLKRAERWRPFRAYAAMMLWESL